MTPIEIISAVFAISIILKTVIFMFKPEALLSFRDKVMAKPNILFIIYLILLIFVGQYIFAEFNIINIFAIGFFVLLLVGLSLIPYYKTLSALGHEMIEKRMNWQTLLVLGIWLVMAGTVLYQLL